MKILNFLFLISASFKKVKDTGNEITEIEDNTTMENIQLNINEIKTTMENIQLNINEIKTTMENIQLNINEIKTNLEKLPSFDRTQLKLETLIRETEGNSSTVVTLEPSERNKPYLKKKKSPGDSCCLGIASCFDFICY